MTSKRALRVTLAASALLTAADAPVTAQLAEVILVPDVAITLPGLGSPLLDRQAVREQLGPPIHRWPFTGLPSLPDGIGVAAIAFALDGALLFALDGWATVPDVGLVGPADVVARTAAGYAVRFAGEAASIPPGVAIDAIGWIGLIQMELSFDSAIEFGNYFANDFQSVIVTNGELDFVSGIGWQVPAGLDVDGMGGGLGGGIIETVSFDGSGEIGGVQFDDEDIVAWHGSNVFSLLYDGTSAGGDWRPADLAAFIVLSPLLFDDAFESGDSTRWSSSSP